MTVSLLPTRLCSAACRDTGFNRVFSLAWAFTPQFYQLHLKVHSSQALNKQSSFLPWNVGKAPWAKHEVNRTNRDMHSCSCSGWDLSDCWAKKTATQVACKSLERLPPLHPFTPFLLNTDEYTNIVAARMSWQVDGAACTAVHYRNFSMGAMNMIRTINNGHGIIL